MLDFTETITDPAFCLDGAALVEASAGTGKTYNIQHVYVRLVLEKGLPVEKILVVTFTEAATLELRDRLRRILTLTRDVLQGGATTASIDKERIETLLVASSIDVADARQVSDALNRVKLAIMDFDNASIFTIHGFCNRALQRYAFECGHDAMAELVASESDVVAYVCRNWWRQHTYNDDDFGSRIPFDSLQQLEELLAEYLRKPDAKLLPEALDTSHFQEQVHAVLARVRQDADLFEDATLITGLLPDAIDWENITLDLRVPESLTALQRAASSVPVPRLQGNFCWQGDTITGPGSKGYAMGSFLAVLDRAKEDLLNWVTRAEPYLPASRQVKDAVTAIRSLCRNAPQTTDAKGVLSAIGMIARMDPEKWLQASKLARTMPAVAELREALHRGRLGRRVAVLKQLSVILREEIGNRSLMTYGDMLRNVMLALSDPARGEHLQDVLRDEFRAALIDEFQDTDAVQYNIFRTLFMGTGIPLIFVGDPKQAIYGFRGGDVFTYYGAKADIANARDERLFSLNTNYRSEARLVAAMNAFFADHAGDPGFLHEAIPYAGDLGAHEMHADKLLSLPEENNQPLQIWQYGEGKKPGQANKRVKTMYADLAGEVNRLLHDAHCRIGSRRIGAGDIAVLVHTHAEAAEICNLLLAQGIHAVQQNSGNVFDTQEARGMGLILQAMLQPSDRHAVRGALVSGLLPCSASQLMAYCLESGEDAGHHETRDSGDTGISIGSLDAWVTLFREAHDCWRRGSFIRAFRFLMQKTGMRAHVVRQPGGERRLTNILHLVELLHHTAEMLRNRPAGLVQWYQRQLDACGREDSNEHLMRMASDEDAVKIMTIHKSKGLQFPIVFVPTLWRKVADAKASNGILSYHDESNHLVSTLDLNDPRAKEKATAEHFQEDLRLLYVALTRAINRVYLVQWGDLDPGKCAVDRLYARIAAGCPDEIAIVSPEAPKVKPIRERAPESEDPPALVAPPLPVVNRKHGHTSFSALEPGVQELTPDDPRDYDVATLPDAFDVASRRHEPDDIFSIPGGKQTGNCWHDIFEQIDFRASDETIGATIDPLLDRYRICRGGSDDVMQARRQSVHRMVRETLAVPLQMAGKAATFCLRDIPLSARRCELGFSFSLKQGGDAVSTKSIRDLLLAHWSGDPQYETFCEALQTHWDSFLPLGYMTGFIDLVFCHQDQFYLVDWKSNRRSGHLADFGPGGLGDEMARNFYFLQYLLYTVALDAYLATRLDGYNYDKHMGGVFYLFLRGIGHAQSKGVFADRPSAGLIRQLSVLLTGGEA
jgi:exodeoxyribonuclease V beta subunit